MMCMLKKSFAHMNDGVIIGRARAMNECMSIAKINVQHEIPTNGQIKL